MRISDWSSDVCSSDLLPLRRLRLHEGREPSEAVGPGVARVVHEDVGAAEGVDRGGHRGVVGDVEDRGERGSAPAGDLTDHTIRPLAVAVVDHDLSARLIQIGRASGRARVWQYV